jgi:hypothetical protein
MKILVKLIITLYFLIRLTIKLRRLYSTKLLDKLVNLIITNLLSYNTSNETNICQQNFKNTENQTNIKTKISRFCLDINVQTQMSRSRLRNLSRPAHFSKICQISTGCLDLDQEVSGF